MTYNRWLWVSLSIKFKLSNILRTGSTALNPACVALLLVDSFHQYSESIVHCAPPKCPQPNMHKVSFATDSMKSFLCLNTIFLFGTENGGCEKTPRQQSSNNMNSMCNQKKPLVGPCVWATYTIAWYVLSQKGFRRAEVWSSKGGGCRAHWHRLRRPQLIIANGRHRHRPPCKKETLHPLWMNTHKHQRKTWAMSPPEIFWQELRR